MQNDNVLARIHSEVKIVKGWTVLGEKCKMNHFREKFKGQHCTKKTFLDRPVEVLSYVYLHIGLHIMYMSNHTYLCM